ncbi:MAG: peptidase S1 [Rhodobacteraceae bacterium]|nr:peptidase S1 [Paracoccaceae bacterium]
MIARFVFALSALVLSVSQAFACPNWRADPYFGTIDLMAGFQPDPYVRNITAGGTINLERCFNGWTGYVTGRPDFDLNWHGSANKLTIAVEAGADAVLLINAPDELFYYNDDTYGKNPVITFINPQPGLYDIWVGSYDGSRRNPARLIITEYDY